jgi:2-oxoglutarate ferredoxin oxidoreductase subunit beta
VVFVSGIGCSSRFPYYMDTYGFHSIHGRAPAIATGLATSRPDLTVFVVTGDGDGLSIGGNHLAHALRRNVNLTIVMFNNRIYGLTKGQYSPTSEVGKLTKSTPFGSIDRPLEPLSFALGAEATFVARSLDTDRDHLAATLEAAARHQGASFVEVYQNCNIFNDGAFARVKDEPDATRLDLVAGEPLICGPDRSRGVVLDACGGLELAQLSDVEASRLVVHDPSRSNPAYAFGLARLSTEDGGVVPMGILREVAEPTYEAQVAGQIAHARETQGEGDLAELIAGKDTWNVA